MGSLLKIVVGIIGVGVIVKFTPILDILYLFFMIVMVPMLLLLSIGFISQGTYDAFAGGLNKAFRDLKDKIQEKRQEMETEVVS